MPISLERALTPEQFAQGMTFQDYVAYIRTPENWTSASANEILSALYERVTIGS